MTSVAASSSVKQSPAKPGPAKPKPAQPADEALRSLVRYQWFGIAAVVAMVGGVGGWAAWTQISGAVIAPGSVVVEGNSKRVQHLEGGIVAAIHVANIDQVKAGQQLIRLDDTEIRANLQITQSQLEELKARQARLTAERDGLAALDIAKVIEEVESNSQRLLLWQGQSKLFATRRGARADKEKQLLDRISQLQEAIRGQQFQLKAKEQQIALVQDELSGLQQLYDQQLVAKPRLLAQQREASKLEGERGQYHSDIARTEVQISETRLQMTEAKQTFMSEVLQELRAKLKRLIVVAPINGVVHKLSVFTVGGVVAPGETVMEVVPDEASLQIEGQLDPNHIDQVKTGQAVFMRFSAIDQRTTPELKGRVVSVSADVRQDAPQMPRYYAVRAVLEEGEQVKLGTSRLVPGMPSELMIKLSDRTVLDYLLKPLTDRIVHTFRER
jgi:HlyD family secretion protein